MDLKTLDQYQILSLTAASVILLIFSITTYYSLSEIAEINNKIHDLYSKTQVELEKVRSGIANIRRFEKDIIINIDDKALQSNYFSRWLSELELINSITKAIKSLTDITDTVIKDITTIENGISEYRQHATPILKATISGTYTTAAQANMTLEPYKTPARDLNLAISGYVDSLAHIELELRNVVDKSAMHAKQRVYILGITLISIFVLLAVFLFMASKHRKFRFLYDATHDKLTGLLNRAGLSKEAETLIANAQNKNFIATIHIDFDNFILISSKYGHHNGNLYLREVSAYLNDLFPEIFIKSRLAADKLVFVLQITKKADALALAEKIRKSVEKFRATTTNISNIFANASTGVVVCKPKDFDIDQAIIRSSIACRMSKFSGKNKSSVFKSSHSETEKFEQSMRAAVKIPNLIEEDRFALFFQKIIPCGNGKQYCEILLRIRNREQGYGSAYQYLDAASQYGIASTIILWCLTKL